MLATSWDAILPFHAPDVSGHAMSFEPSSPNPTVKISIPAALAAVAAVLAWRQ